MMAKRSSQGNLSGRGRPGRRGSDRGEAFWGELTNWLDDWLAINPDGTVSAFSGKVELGTGVRTALAQIVAEELDLPLEDVHMVMGDTEQTPDEGYTAGSMTISSSGTALRNAAAKACQILLEMAAQRLHSPLDELTVQAGLISLKGRPDQKVSYAELMGGQPFNCEVTGDAPVKDPKTYTIVGTSTRREDIPRKVTGQPSFIQDLRLPGMLHARLVRPPSAAAEFLSMDESLLANLPSLVKVVQRGNFIAVLAEREEQAILAAQQLKVEWRESASMPAMPELYKSLRSQATQDAVLVDQGDYETAIQQAARQVHASYYQPYHAHASIGPSCAVADVKEDQITVWSSTPGPHPVSGALAQLLNVPTEKVHLIHVEGAGSYGQNGADDAAADAVILSQALGRPVRLQWSRQDEFVWEPKAPAMVMEVHGGLDRQGSVIAWDYHVWSPSHVSRARSAEGLVASQLIRRQAASQFGFSFGAERNAPTNYSFPNQRVTVHYLADSPLRASSFRSLGGAENTFANESFMDELAAAAGMDALDFRLQYLADERAREVLKAAAEKAGWERRPSWPGKMKPLAEGRGLAFAWYENDQALVACVACLQVEPASGAVRVKRIVVSHDCGLIINPDGLRNQIEGNIIQSLSRALKEEVLFDEMRIKSLDWDSYPILTFSEVPEVEIVLINRPDQPAVGAGEPATITTAAAVANAIYDATGARLRQIPFTPERVKEALPSPTPQPPPSPDEMVLPQ
jgi:nicotinate dehydrogenase subunit B